MAQMWYDTTIPGVGTATTMPLPTGGQPRRSQVLERRSDQTRNQAFEETDESLPVRSGYWAMKALIRAADMLRDGVGVVLVLVALASPAAAGNFLWGLGNAGIALQGAQDYQLREQYLELQRQQIELMKRGIVPPPLPPMPTARQTYSPPPLMNEPAPMHMYNLPDGRTITCNTAGMITNCF